ncbi:hypothetical protein D047_1569A, partial [Vibrio parahaemolyticus VPTS-2010_2]
MPFRDP